MKNFLLSLWYKYKEWRWERKCIKHLGMKPEVIKVSQEDYDALVEQLSQPPKYNENLVKLFQKKSPWDEDT